VRCEGHWIGGAEINVCATFVAGVVVVGGALLVFGTSPLVYGAGALFVVAFGLCAQRRSRALFFAIDYLVDPVLDPRPGEPRDVLQRGDRAPPSPPCAPRVVRRGARLGGADGRHLGR
jgi:hypothetical protein